MSITKANIFNKTVIRLMAEIKDLKKQVDDLEHDKKCLMADAARLRRELDDCNGEIR